MQSKYTIKRLSHENIRLLMGLYREVFKKKISLEYVKKKYSTKQFGTEYIGYLAFHEDGILMAYYGVVPCVVVIEGQNYLAAQSVDTMTHPRAQKQGLFTLLAEKTYELAKANHIKFVFGFPNQNSFPGFVKLGWTFTEQRMKMFKISVRTIPFAKIVTRTKVLDVPYTLLLRLFFETKIDAQKLFQSNVSGVKHDQRFIEYKAYHKSFLTSLGDAAAWFRCDRVLHIGYLRIGNAPNPSLLNKLKRIAMFTGCTEILAITNKDSPVYQLMSTQAKPQDSFQIGFFNLSDTPLAFEKIAFDYCDIDIF